METGTGHLITAFMSALQAHLPAPLSPPISAGRPHSLEDPCLTTKSGGWAMWLSEEKPRVVEEGLTAVNCSLTSIRILW